jgi:hypothetical protein
VQSIHHVVMTTYKRSRDPVASRIVAPPIAVLLNRNTAFVRRDSWLGIRNFHVLIVTNQS